MTDHSIPQGKERRIYIRTMTAFSLMFSVKSPFEVRIQLGEKEIDAVAQDISEGGLGMLTNYEVPLGSRVSMKFKIFNESALKNEDSYRAFELQGDVRYCGITKETDYRLGIQFVSIAATDRDFIASYVKTNKLRPNPFE